MRIVFDTQSRSWIVFKSWLGGILILFLMLFATSIIECLTGWDTDFFSGYLVAYHIYKYKWNP